MLLHDPAGQEGWTGTFRVVVQVHADVEEEMAADPLLGEVGWSWLTDALDLHAPGYGAPSGTVTRVITEGYGAKADEPPSTGFELRASWCPADDEIDGRDRRRRRSPGATCSPRRRACRPSRRERPGARRRRATAAAAADRRPATPAAAGDGPRSRRRSDGRRVHG